MKRFSAGQAKARFGQLLEAAATGPVTIEKHGRAVAVMLSKDEYDELQRARRDQLNAALKRGLDDLDAGRCVEIDRADFDGWRSIVKAGADPDKQRG